MNHPLFDEEGVNYDEIYDDWKFKTQFYHKPKTILQIAFIVAGYVKGDTITSSPWPISRANSEI